MKLTKKSLAQKKTKKHKPISLLSKTNSSQKKFKSNKKNKTHSFFQEKPQQTDKNIKPSNPMDEEIKHSKIKNQMNQNQHSKKNQLNVLGKVKMMNQNEKDMLQGYIEAIKYLENPKNQPQIKNIHQSQINYLRATECSVCCDHFDTENKKPMIVCSNSSSHILCSSCLQKEINFNQYQRCYICRRSIKKEDVKVDDEILTWLKVNKKLGIQTPTLHGLIPKELYESLRKISFHDLAKIQTKRNIEESQKIKFEMIRMKMANKILQSQINQKELKIKQIEQRMKVNIESCEAISKQLESLRMNAIYRSSSTLSRKQSLINSFKRKKEEMNIDIQFLVTMDSKYEELIPQMVQHQKKEHQGKSLYRSHQAYYCMHYDTKSKAYYPYLRASPSSQCLECKTFIKQAQNKIKHLENYRYESLEKFYTFINKFGYMVLLIFQQFLPKTVEQFRQDRKKYFHLIDKQQVSILKEIFSQNFQKTDINHFWKMLKAEQDSSLQNKNTQMKNEK